MTPVISAEECLKALKKRGYHFKEQTGSHIHVEHETTFHVITVPNHKTLSIGMLAAIAKQFDMTAVQFADKIKNKKKPSGKGKKKK